MADGRSSIPPSAAPLAVAAQRGFSVGCGAGGTESFAVGRRCGGELTPEGASHGFVGAEATGVGDRRELLVTALEPGFGRFEKRAVVVGRSDDRLTEIATGLKPGEIIAATNTFPLKAEFLKGQTED